MGNDGPGFPDNICGEALDDVFEEPSLLGTCFPRLVFGLLDVGVEEGKGPDEVGDEMEEDCRATKLLAKGAIRDAFLREPSIS